jgi:cyclic pyranopterin phosphate synthase
MTQPVTQWQTQAAVKDRLSRPLRDLRISVIDRCNYRCPYCMPAELYGENHQFLPRAHWLTPGEIKRVAGVFLQLGVRKLRLTGGEPLLRRDIVEIVAALSSLNGAEDLALTTNGSRLAEHATELKAAGLNRLTVSLDSLDEAVFKEMNGGRGELGTVLNGIEAARRAGFPLKVNVVVDRTKNDQTVLDLVEHFRGTGVIVRFI